MATVTSSMASSQSVRGGDPRHSRRPTQRLVRRTVSCSAVPTRWRPRPPQHLPQPPARPRVASAEGTSSVAYLAVRLQRRAPPLPSPREACRPRRRLPQRCPRAVASSSALMSPKAVYVAAGRVHGGDVLRGLIAFRPRQLAPLPPLPRASSCPWRHLPRRCPRAVAFAGHNDPRGRRAAPRPRRCCQGAATRCAAARHVVTVDVWTPH